MVLVQRQADKWKKIEDPNMSKHNHSCTIDIWQRCQIHTEGKKGHNERTVLGKLNSQNNL